MSKPGDEAGLSIEHKDVPYDTASEHDQAADRANEVDKSLSIREAFHYYKRATLWSVGVSNATIMESYMLLLPNSFYAQPQFQKKYGEEIRPGVYSIPTQWQIGVSMAGLVGLIIGVFSNGIVADRFGLRKTMIASHLSMMAFIFILFFAPSIEVILVGLFFL